MRGSQYSDARGPIWHSFWAFAGVTMVCVITVFLIRRLPLPGVGIGALDLTIAALWFFFRGSLSATETEHPPP